MRHLLDGCSIGRGPLPQPGLSLAPGEVGAVRLVWRRRQYVPVRASAFLLDSLRFLSLCTSRVVSCFRAGLAVLGLSLPLPLNLVGY